MSIATRGFGSHKAVVRVASFLILLPLAGTQTACGTSGHSSSAAKSRQVDQQSGLLDVHAADREVIVRIGPRSFTGEDLERATPLGAVLWSRFRTARSLPVGVVPDPPIYAHCVAYLAAVTKGSLAPRQLRAQCEHLREAQARLTLSELIISTWLHEEATKRRISVTNAEVRRILRERGIRGDLLKALGVPAAYQDFILEGELLRTKLLETLPAYLRAQRAKHETMRMADEVDNENSKFSAALKARWTRRTRCASGFIVPGCSEYRAASSP